MPDIQSSDRPNSNLHTHGLWVHEGLGLSHCQIVKSLNVLQRTFSTSSHFCRELHTDHSTVMQTHNCCMFWHRKGNVICRHKVLSRSFFSHFEPLRPLHTGSIFCMRFFRPSSKKRHAQKPCKPSTIHLIILFAAKICSTKQMESSSTHNHFNSWMITEHQVQLQVRWSEVWTTALRNTKV